MIMGKFKEAYTDHRGRMPHEAGYCFDTSSAAYRKLPYPSSDDQPNDPLVCQPFHLYCVDEACRAAPQAYTAHPKVVIELARLLATADIRLPKPWSSYLTLQHLVLDANAAMTCVHCQAQYATLRPWGTAELPLCRGCYEKAETRTKEA